MATTVHIVDHPLVAERLTTMRDKATSNDSFRRALDEMTTLLVYEATRGLRTSIVDIETPVAQASAVEIDENVVLVPILRAGLGMLGSATALLPGALIGFVGMARNELTHMPDPYMESLPANLDDERVIVLDPMLATGGSLVACLETLHERGARSITVVCVIAAPEGIEHVKKHSSDLDIFTAALDDKLNEDAFIVPGLGDAGDRQFGAARR